MNPMSHALWNCPPQGFTVYAQLPCSWETRGATGLLEKLPEDFFDLIGIHRRSQNPAPSAKVRHLLMSEGKQAREFELS
jgi:hypothetical protein